MSNEVAKRIHYLLFTFMGLFHKNIFHKFRQENIIDSCLKKNHKKILNILYQYDKLTLTEICKLIDIEKGSLTTLIDFLEEKKMVMRLNDPNDRRKTLISLTSEGKAEMENVMEFFAGKIDESLEKYDREEVEKFQNCLEYVVDFMKRI